MARQRAGPMELVITRACTGSATAVGWKRGACCRPQRDRTQQTGSLLAYSWQRRQPSLNCMGHLRVYPLAGTNSQQSDILKSYLCCHAASPLWKALERPRQAAGAAICWCWMTHRSPVRHGTALPQWMAAG